MVGDWCGRAEQMSGGLIRVYTMDVLIDGGCRENWLVGYTAWPRAGRASGLTRCRRAYLSCPEEGKEEV